MGKSMISGMFTETNDNMVRTGTTLHHPIQHMSTNLFFYLLPFIKPQYGSLLRAIEIMFEIFQEAEPFTAE